MVKLRLSRGRYHLLIGLCPRPNTARPRTPSTMPVPTLAEAVAQYGREAYLLTIANDGPHTSFVSVDLKGNVIACVIGKSAAMNIASQPSVSLFWPPREPGGYALVVN